MRHRTLWRVHFRRYSVRRTEHSNATPTARRPSTCRSDRPPAACARTAQSRYRVAGGAQAGSGRLPWGRIGETCYPPVDRSHFAMAVSSLLRRGERRFYEGSQWQKKYCGWRTSAGTAPRFSETRAQPSAFRHGEESASDLCYAGPMAAIRVRAQCRRYSKFSPLDLARQHLPQQLACAHR
jgi:hypothetical protein